MRKKNGEFGRRNTVSCCTNFIDGDTTTTTTSSRAIMEEKQQQNAFHQQKKQQNRTTERRRNMDEENEATTSKKTTTMRHPLSFAAAIAAQAVRMIAKVVAAVGLGLICIILFVQLDNRHYCSISLLQSADLRFFKGHLLNCRQWAQWPPPHSVQLLAAKGKHSKGEGNWNQAALAAHHPLASMLIVEEQPASLFNTDDDDDDQSASREVKEDALIIRPSSSLPEWEQEMRRWREPEALAALQAAKRSRSEGNVRKARSIIEHAYSLAPYNPDILTEYGVFCETVQGDVVEGERFYLKALYRDPKHKEALIRRQRALPLVEAIDNAMMRKIQQKLERFMRIPRTDAGLRRSMRESYFQHVYHTVAMEGNTINLAQTRSILETKMAIGGKSIVEHNEILGLDAALRWLNQSLTDVGEITLEHLLQLHKRILGYADPIAAGQLRTVQVYVGTFRPPDPSVVPHEMAEFVQWLNDEETLGLDPVEVAALAHYKLVFIHPFMDGNGRTGRLLMNWILLRAGFPPVIIPVERRSRYYQVLQEANNGDLRPFIRFVRFLTENSLDSFISSSISSTTEDIRKSREEGGMCEFGGDCSYPPLGRKMAKEVNGGDQQHTHAPFCTP